MREQSALRRGGVAGMLMVSVLLILFGRIEIGSMTDLLLSLPIWINEMALALWLIFRGVDMSALPAHRLGGAT